MQNTPAAQAQNDNTVFGFIFRNLEVFILLFMAFLIYALFETFTQHVSKHALFIAEPDRLTFSQMLIFGLMAVEILLALATSFFRRQGEWVKSFLVTIIALVIAYYNHLSITEIFKELGASSEAVKMKIILCNWLIFALGEVVSLLMNSKGKEQAEEVPAWFLQYTQAHRTATPAHTPPLVDVTGNPLHTAQIQQPIIGFQMKGNIAQAKMETAPTAQRKPRGKSIDHERAKDLLSKGLSCKEVAQILRCTESSIHKIKVQQKG